MRAGDAPGPGVSGDRPGADRCPFRLPVRGPFQAVEAHPASSRIHRAERAAVRRRYVRAIELRGGRALNLVADLDNGIWASLTFYPSRAPQANLRKGLRIYERGEE